MGRLLSLSPPAQCLFLRLLLRRGPWFTQSGLSYSEVADVGAAAEELLGAGMARRPATEDWPQVRRRKIGKVWDKAWAGWRSGPQRRNVRR